MKRLKTLSDVYVRPKSISKGPTTFLQLHILSNQLERLSYNKEEILEKLEQIDSRLNYLKYHYTTLQKTIVFDDI